MRICDGHLRVAISHVSMRQTRPLPPSRRGVSDFGPEVLEDLGLITFVVSGRRHLASVHLDPGRLL